MQRLGLKMLCNFTGSDSFYIYQSYIIVWLQRAKTQADGGLSDL